MSDDTKAAPDATILDRLYDIIEARRGADQTSSYTAQLLAEGVPKVAQKFGEEAVETLIASTTQDNAALAAESADLLYHLAVLWAAKGVRPADVWQILADREGVSGLAEKAARET